MEGMRRNNQRTRVIIAILSALILISMVLSGVAMSAGASPVPTTDRRSGVESSDHIEAAVAAEVGDTTTTLPEDNRVFGKSITRPNQGMEPQSPGDPGGWLQSSLFFLVCGTVILMIIGVSLRARKLRVERKEAGLDPVDLARKRGTGVRAPSPLDNR